MGLTVAGWISGDALADDAPTRLFCFAHAGGGGGFFRPWRGALGEDTAVCPVVLPGREGRVREAPFTRIGPLVDALVDGLGPHLDRPFAFFGHSLGSIVAFELAKRLRETGHAGPGCLIASGRRAPQLPNRRRDVHALPSGDFVAEMLGLGGTPPELVRQPELLEFFLPVLRADFELNETYRPAPAAPLDCPVFGFTGDADPLADPDEVAAWARVTTGPFGLRVFRGDHFYLRDSTGVLAAVRADLRRARRLLAQK
ncbi:Thioesterase [Actinokineospora spheciospongiae]|uniref:Thioesterase n=1 Tax=Actinokineospora spheciospongiae TaxID=909613 RepID=W7ITP4_9PSEU|nr:thioesterase domain-containing protein [Actinokineospora sp. PR83]EWC63733.1 Thioesterase [Actinokineospora spheciospongiae]MCG8916185.1 alpha/beta fold hydrolase [Actinokineospora sp. PR83]